MNLALFIQAFEFKYYFLLVILKLKNMKCLLKKFKLLNYMPVPFSKEDFTNIFINL